MEIFTTKKHNNLFSLSAQLSLINRDNNTINIKRIYEKGFDVNI